MLTASDLLLGALPAILWLVWVWKKDPRTPEPPRLVLRVFVLGGLAALAQVALRPRIEFLLIGSGASAKDILLDAFVITAASEELLKSLAFVLGALFCRDWDEPQDGLVYGAAAGLGFAAVENAYFLAATGDTSVIWQRGFTSTFAHVAFSAGLAFTIGLARLHLIALPRAIGVGAFYAVGMHGAYDLLLSKEGGMVYALLLVLPVLMLVFSLKLRRTSDPAWDRHLDPARS